MVSLYWQSVALASLLCLDRWMSQACSDKCIKRSLVYSLWASNLLCRRTGVLDNGHWSPVPKKGTDIDKFKDFSMMSHETRVMNALGQPFKEEFSQKMEHLKYPKFQKSCFLLNCYSLFLSWVQLGKMSMLSFGSDLDVRGSAKNHSMLQGWAHLP